MNPAPVASWRHREAATKEEKNIFTETDKRNGQVHMVVSKSWPDGERFRRRCQNLATARNLVARINGAIATGTWKEVREELTEKPKQPPAPAPDLMVRDLADIYLEKYCKVMNTRPDFKEETLEVIKDIVGDAPISTFRRADALHFVDVRSKQKVSGATVNRGIAVLSNMFTFALDRELVDAHPMVRFKRLPEPETVLQVMTLEEERRLVEEVMKRDHRFLRCDPRGNGNANAGRIRTQMGTCQLSTTESYGSCIQELQNARYPTVRLCAGSLEGAAPDCRCSSCVCESGNPWTG
jgi:hypothetical protein